jgi:CO/xanthine dehydrogenase FAD-binding subunit
MSLCDLPRYEMMRPPSLAEACRLLHERHARGERTLLLAGGTDLFVEIKSAPVGALERPLPVVLDVGRLAELRPIRRDAGTVFIGAAATFREIGREPVVGAELPLLAAAARDIGGPSIQARATLGGNLGTGSPAADGVAAIAALGAVVLVESVRGRRPIPFAALQTGYKQSTRADDEIVVGFELAPRTPGTRWSWRKVGPRRAQAISKVALATVAELADGRIVRFSAAAAAVAPVTALMPRTCALVTGARLGSLVPDAVDQAVDADASPIDDLRSTRDYRAHCLRALVRAALVDLGAFA